MAYTSSMKRDPFGHPRAKLTKPIVDEFVSDYVHRLSGLTGVLEVWAAPRGEVLEIFTLIDETFEELEMSVYECELETRQAYASVLPDFHLYRNEERFREMVGSSQLAFSAA
jgi:hypothetical protein